MQTWALALDESYDIAGTEARQGGASGTESIRQESADERHVVGDGGLRQCALGAQVSSERQCLLLNRGQSAWCHPPCGNDAFATLKLEQLSQRGGITSVDLYAPSA